MESCDSEAGSCGNQDGGAVQPTKPEPIPSHLKYKKKAIKGRKELPESMEQFMKRFLRMFRNVLVNSTTKFEKLLVAYSGGLASSAMLHLLHSYVAEKSSKQPYHEVTVLHIDTGAAVKMDMETRTAKKQQIAEIVKSYGWSLIDYNLEDVFANNNNTPNQSADALLLQYLNSFESYSSREDALKLLIRDTIVTIAHEKDFPKVLIGESANNLAVRVISDISKGRGFTIPLIIKDFDSHLSGTKNIMFIRPVKDGLLKELAFYNHQHGVKTIFYPDLTTALPLKTTSIDRLTESFIAALQADYPSTVHTILRTTEKLKTPILNEQFYCSLCGAVMTNQETQQLLDTLSQTDKETIEMLESKFAKTTLQNQVLLEKKSFAQFCCYGCKRLLSDKKSMKNVLDSINEVNASLLSTKSDTEDQTAKYQVNLQRLKAFLVEKEDLQQYPPNLLANMNESYSMAHHKGKFLNREEMKQQINEFLLE